MYISFCKNVYLVEGYKKSCIYDLNSKKMYHFGDKEKLFLKKIVGEDSERIFLSKEEKKILDNLIDLQLIEYANEIRYGDISEYEPTPVKISFAWIEVTQQCNLKCIHCYDEAGPSCKSVMSLSDYCRVIDQLVEIGVPNIQLIGGEPLVLGKELKKMVDYAYGKFNSIEVFTNATLMSDDWIEFFKKHQIKIATSIYSYLSQEHDKVTGVEGSHNCTVSALKKVIDNGISYRTATVLMDGIAKGEKENEFYSIDKADVIRMSGRGCISLLNKELLRKKEITKRRFESELSISLFNRLVQGHNCFSRRLYISSNLDVFPCVMERKIKHGNMKDIDLCNCIQKDILQMNKNRIRVCKDCEFRYACHDCRPDRISEEIDEKPWFCDYDPYTSTWTKIDIKSER